MIKEYRLRLNHQKCNFGVTARKLLGFLVSDRGIEVDPSKIKGMLEMPPPMNEMEIRGFLGRLQYINQFIAKLTSTCEPIFKHLRKSEPYTWNNECQKQGISPSPTYPSTSTTRKTLTLIPLYHRGCGWKYACTRKR